MLPWAQEIDSLAEQSGFAGVVAVDRDGEIEFAKAYGLADRAHQVPNTLDTRFAIASGTKGLTALAVVSLISDGALHLSTTARSVLDADLPLQAPVSSWPWEAASRPTANRGRRSWRVLAGRPRCIARGGRGGS
jgi:CubicO group peptidase (beta-lactamase class C family)